MLTLALATLVAHAAPAADVACMPLQITDTVPAANAVDVPIDANLTVLFDGNCGGSSQWLIEVVDSTGTAVVSETWDWDGSAPALATIDPDADMPANSALTLRATPNGGYYGSEILEVPFTTGDALVQGVVGQPIVVMTGATWYTEMQFAEAVLDITPGEDPDHLSVIKVEANGVVQYLPGTAPMIGQYFSWSEATRPAELCVTVTQIDGAGAAGDPVEACAVPVIQHATGGCLGGGDTVAVPMQALMLLGGLGLIRRRKP